MEIISIPAIVHPQDRSLEGKLNGYMLVPVLLRLAVTCVMDT